MELAGPVDQGQQRRRRRGRVGRRAAVAWVAGCCAAAMVGPSSAWGADYHPIGAPQLSSRPGAAYTIFLDFSGFNFTGTWGSGGSTPGSMLAYDKAANGFSTADQATMAQIWAAVSQKYAAFNVNVTTIDPAVTAGKASTDATRQAYYDSQAKMMHTLITAAAFMSGSGGVSYVGVTQSAESTTANSGASYGYHTNFVNTDGVGLGAQDVGEAAGHENGHGLGLNHQSDFNGSTLVNPYSAGTGTGAGSVAPMMGVSYNSQRGLFRNGLNSSDVNQNDVAVIASQTGMTLVDDGVGHTLANAAFLPATVSGIVNFAAAKGTILPVKSASGYTPIGVANYTTDLFAFNASGGTVSLVLHDGADRVLPGVTDHSPVLASSFNVLNASGGIVATATESFTTQTETFSQTLAAGKYYIQVSSAGGETGVYNSASGSQTSTYYDLGDYYLTGTGIGGRQVGNFYWAGGATTNQWSLLSGGTTNWRTDHANGVDTAAVPGATDNVFLGVDSGAANLSMMSLGTSRTINSLTFTGTGTSAASTSVVIAADGSTLSLAPYNGHLDQSASSTGGGGVGAGIGLTVQAGAAADSILANVALPIGQTWNIANAVANPLTVSGVVSGAAGAGLNVTGGGKLVLTGTNTFSGGTTISGTAVSFAAGSLGTGQVTLNSAGILQFATGNTTDLTASGRVVAIASGGGTIDTNGNSPTLAGGVADGFAGTMTKTGGGTLTLGGTSNPTGLFARGGGIVLLSGASYSTVNPTASTADNYASVGLSSGDSATLGINGGATLTIAGDLNIADQTDTAGTLNILTSGTVNTRNLYVGKSGTANGQVLQFGGALSEADNGTTPVDWKIGGAGSSSDSAAVGVYNLSGGTVNTGAANLSVGAYGTGKFIETAGAVTVGGTLAIGRYIGGVGSYDLSAGTGTLTANTAARLIVGQQGTGTLAVGGSSVVNANELAVGYSSGSATTGSVVQTGGTVNAATGVTFGGAGSGAVVISATYTLGGGTLSTPSISQGTGSTKTTGTFHFAGGTLAATAATTTFLQGLTKADVTTGGARINTGGFGITVAQPLLHDTTLGTTADGGLTKMGLGTLALSGAETYTGATLVSAGTLAVNGSLVAASAVAVPVGSTLAGTGTANGTVAVSGTISAGAGATPADTIGVLHTGVESWFSGGLYAVKLDPTKAVTDTTGKGKSAAAGVAADELVMTGLSLPNNAFTVSPVLFGTGAFSTGKYSFVIADDTASTTAFNALLSSISVGPTPANTAATLGTMTDGTGEDLLLNLSVTAAPEPAGLVLLGLGALPMLLGRRRLRSR